MSVIHALTRSLTDALTHMCAHTAHSTHVHHSARNFTVDGPLVLGGDKLFAGSSSFLYALNTLDGAIQWQATGCGRGVLEAGGATLFLLSVDDTSVIALHTTDGSIKWQQANVTGFSGRSLSISGTSLYFVCSDAVFALHTTDGSIKWQTGISSDAGVVSPDAATLFVFVHGMVDGSDGSAAAVNTLDGTILWQQQFDESVYGVMPSSDGTRLFVTTERGETKPGSYLSAVNAVPPT